MGSRGVYGFACGCARVPEHRDGEHDGDVEEGEADRAGDGHEGKADEEEGAEDDEVPQVEDARYPTHHALFEVAHALLLHTHTRGREHARDERRAKGGCWQGGC